MSVVGRYAYAYALAFVALAGCSRGSQAPADAGADPGDAHAKTTSAAYDPEVLARAEDLRRAKDVPPEIRTSHDVRARRRSARALARIADAPSFDALSAHLADEDPEVVAWAAYGLGHACKGKEEASVRMLAARGASLATAQRGDAGARAEVDPFVAIARAIGRCGGGALGEQVLASLLGSGGPWREPALLGLGDLATRRKQLGAQAMTALLEAASASPPSDLAFYALSRADAGEAFGSRVMEVARSALGRPSDARILAIKTLGRTGREHARESASELGRVVVDAKTSSAAERAEAARVLGTLGEPGQSAAAEALARLAPDKDPLAISALLGPASEFHVLLTTIGALGPEPPKKAERALVAISTIAAPAEPKPALARRLAELRCAAALGLARGAHDAEVLRKCDAESSEISQRARLTSLLRRPLTGERKNAFRAFAKSDHLRVREAAVEAIAQHPELGDAAAPILAEALASKKGGLVATAAEVLHMHPERAMVLAESEKRAALDPKAPPPTANPSQELARDVNKALASALSEKWPEDRFETKMALVDAAASVRHPQAKAAATAACNDANAVVRDRAQKALRALGESVAACDAHGGATLAAEIGKTLEKPQKVIFETDAASVSLVLEPELSPVTATRLAALVRSGFYKGIVVHRVVPGFVVQLGDPDGDGYGGSGTPLRCETSPVSFAPFDVGMALAGRDTGSSQLFVTLSRTPHLEGEYTRVGRAEGDWSVLAQGDVIVDAKLVD
ncbi:MAG: peptidylprolyl isomerase [Labilithrix sp.]|nr:peptidylprolyl isomerase [Labilithrix sp.]